MKIPLQYPLTHASQLQPMLQAAFPSYTFRVQGVHMNTARSPWTGVAMTPCGDHLKICPSAPPNPVAAACIFLWMVPGILPGVIAYFIWYLITRGKANRLQANIAAVIQGWPIPHPEPVPGAPGAAGSGGVGLKPIWMLGVAALLLGGVATAGWFTFDLLGGYFNQKSELAAMEQLSAEMKDKGVALKGEHETYLKERATEFLVEGVIALFCLLAAMGGTGVMGFLWWRKNRALRASP